MSLPLMGAFERKKARMLTLSLIFDCIGMASYFIPGAAEVTDLAWAPVAALLYFAMYRGALGFFGGSFTFLEEMIPFTDVIPSFTLTWFYVYMIREEKTRKRFMAS